MLLPETPAGHDAEVREIQGQCVEGAQPVLVNQSGGLDYGRPSESIGVKPSFCKANGQWHVLEHSACECLPGFEPSLQDNACSGCPDSTYKPLAGPEACRFCPPTSSSEASTASTKCVCSRPLFTWHVISESGIGVCAPDLPRPGDLEVVEKNAERIVITWKPLINGKMPIPVAISCIDCQADEAVYVPGSVVDGSRVTVLGLRINRTYTFAFRSCLNKEDVLDSCDLRASHLTVKAGEYPSKRLAPHRGRQTLNATGTQFKENSSVAMVFHALLGSTVFICVTLAFVSGAMLLHRRYNRRQPPKRQYEFINNIGKTPSRPIPIQTHNTGYGNSLFQVGHVEFHQLPIISRDSIEISKYLGNGRFGEVYLGLLKPSLALATDEFRTPGHTVGPTKLFLRSLTDLDSAVSIATAVAEIATAIKHPQVVECYGIVKGMTPNLLEISRAECDRSKNEIASSAPSPMLSTRVLFRMLRDIAAGCSFLASLAIQNLQINSSAVVVASDYSCKLQIKTWFQESTPTTDHPASPSLSCSLAAFLGITPPLSKVILVHEGDQVIVPGVLKLPPDVLPSTLFGALISTIKSSSNGIQAANNESTASSVKSFGWIQLEVLLAGVFCQRCVLLCGLPDDVELKPFQKTFVWRDQSGLVENVVALIACWFSNEFLGYMLRSCLEDDATRRPCFDEVENHLQKYLADGGRGPSNKISAVIHRDDTLPVPKLTTFPEIYSQKMPAKWNNLHLAGPCEDMNRFYASDTV
ncbi:unnamed protein product [Mesocestoides corti]|uniref:Protein kinase domain-containing protein n=1 Tax=Mesocestoides corti TaxID=53468 RepID=A0A0R3UKZ4_MESCO|nr:unnamed protein product [Mesocestoides corti]